MLSRGARPDPWVLSRPSPIAIDKARAGRSAERPESEYREAERTAGEAVGNEGPAPVAAVTLATWLFDAREKEEAAVDEDVAEANAGEGVVCRRAREATGGVLATVEADIQLLDDDAEDNDDVDAVCTVVGMVAGMFCSCEVVAQCPHPMP